MNTVYLRELSPTWETLTKIIPTSTINGQMGFFIPQNLLGKLKNFILNSVSTQPSYFNEVVLDINTLPNADAPFFLTTQFQKGVYRLRKVLIGDKAGAAIARAFFDQKWHMFVEFESRAIGFPRGFLADNGFPPNPNDIISLWVEESALTFEDFFLEPATVAASYVNTDIINKIKISFAGDKKEIGENILNMEIKQRIHLLQRQHVIPQTSSDFLWKTVYTPVGNNPQQGWVSVKNNGRA